jgi:4-diphosphocytidyl-2-C-methyl-D-erythritol kinase
MSTCTLLAPAKINLYLEILGDRADGYHELAMILQSITLADRLELRSTHSNKIEVHCDHPEVPTDSTNLAYRAGELMRQKFPDRFARAGGLAIDIQKNIPVGAGLAGGSTDAAAVLVGIDLLWNVGLTKSELEVLGTQLGSDVPFCVEGGTVLATGRGTQLSPLPDLDHLWVVLAKFRSLSVSTAWAYTTYRHQFESGYVRDEEGLSSRHQEVHSGPMVAAILQRDGQTIGKLLHNDLEKTVLPAHPAVETLRQSFAEQPGILGTLMSGSGPTVFALCESQILAEETAHRVKNQMSDPDLDFWVTRFSATGIQLETSGK